MPKRVKQPRRDANQSAFDVVRRTIASEGDAPAPVSFQAQLSAHMKKIGKKGGKVSGARRMANLTAEQRQEIAAKAARARWGRQKRTKTGG